MKNPTLEYLFQTRPENLKDWTEEDEEKFIIDLGELLDDSAEEAINEFFLPYFQTKYSYMQIDTTTGIDEIQCEVEDDDGES